MKRLFVGGWADGTWQEVDPGQELVRLYHPDPPVTGILTRPLSEEDRRQTVAIVPEDYCRHQIWGSHLAPGDASGVPARWESHVIAEFFTLTDVRGDDAIRALINGYARDRSPNSIHFGA